MCHKFIHEKTQPLIPKVLTICLPNTMNTTGHQPTQGFHANSPSPCDPPLALECQGYKYKRRRTGRGGRPARRSCRQLAKCALNPLEQTNKAMKLNASAAYFRLQTTCPFHRETLQLTWLKFWARKMKAVSHLQRRMISIESKQEI